MIKLIKRIWLSTASLFILILMIPRIAYKARFNPDKIIKVILAYAKFAGKQVEEYVKS